MTAAVVFLVLCLLAVAGLALTTLVVAVRGGRGPGDPPASHPRVDPAGFFVLSRPRGLLDGSQRRRAIRPTAATIAAVVQTARDSRTARGMSPAPGARPSPSVGRTSVRLP